MTVMLFATDRDRSTFIRQLRLFQDDLHSYADAAGSYAGIQTATQTPELLQGMNRHPGFWLSVFASLQTTAFISLTRIHDKGKHAYFAKVLKTLNASASPKAKNAAKQLTDAVNEHQTFIGKAIELRHALFAHTAHEAPLFASFGFEGLTLDMFEAYWNSMAAGAKAAEESVFKGVYGPQVDVASFSKAKQEALDAALSQAALVNVGPTSQS